MNHLWHHLTVEKTIKLLKSNCEQGLTEKEVQERLKKYGFNKLPEKKRLSALRIFLNQFKSPLVYILIIAAFICLALKEFIDMGIIWGAVLINSLVGFFQENKAEKTFEHLKKMVHYNARVIRDGKEKIIDNSQLVPGDIIILEAGDIVPADARLISVHNFQTKEAALTGESIPSAKIVDILKEGASLADRENMAYFGTNVVHGRAMAIVVATGLRTEIGQIAKMLKKTPDEMTPLQKKIGHLAKILGIIIASLSALLFVVGILMGRSFLEMLLTSVAVAVAGIPEGLLVAVTVCLAIGMQKILKNKALTRKLVAAETLGSITVIATDKTGTLTEGKMSVAQVLPSKGLKPEELLKIGILCNDVVVEESEVKLEEQKMTGDTTEVALIQGAIHSGMDRNKILKQYPRLDEIPFESEKMYMATLNHIQGKKDKAMIYLKGAPEIVINLANLDQNEKKKIKEQFEKLTKQGLRVLAFAKKEINQKEEIKDSDLKQLKFVGLIALKDPLRSEAKKTIASCLLAGIRPIMVTGDHKLTAKTIGIEVGLIKQGDEILEGIELDKISDKELIKKLKKINVFARVEPKHKIRIVKLLQEQGEVVAMTGDGVNDAPALKAADIGVALGSGSEVTKGTADLVLLDDNFKTIVEAIKTGRNIFNNIKKVVLFLLTDTFTEFILIGGALVLGLPLPILASQILWVNIIEDTLPALALSYEKEGKDILKEKARGHQGHILDREMKVLIFIIGLSTDLLLLGLFWYFNRAGMDIVHLRTLVFVGLGIGSLFYVFACKRIQKSIWHYNPLDNPILNLSIIFGWAMFLIALYIPFFQKILRVSPLHWKDWLLLVSIGILNLFLIELGKRFFIHPLKPKKQEKTRKQEALLVN